MTTDDENCIMLLTEKHQKYHYYHLEKLINKKILKANKYYLLIKEERQKKLSFLILFQEKLQKKPTKSIEDKGKKQTKALEEHGKQLTNLVVEKIIWKRLKQKENFDELVHEKRFEINKLSEGIDFNDSTYYYTSKRASKYFVRFKGPLIICNDIKNGRIS